MLTLRNARAASGANDLTLPPVHTDIAVKTSPVTLGTGAETGLSLSAGCHSGHVCYQVITVIHSVWSRPATWGQFNSARRLRAATPPGPRRVYLFDCRPRCHTVTAPRIVTHILSSTTAGRPLRRAPPLSSRSPPGDVTQTRAPTLCLLIPNTVQMEGKIHVPFRRWRLGMGGVPCAFCDAQAGAYPGRPGQRRVGVDADG